MALTPSLTGTGIAGTDGTLRTIRPGKLRGVPRLVHIRDAVALEVVGFAMVVIEGYSYGSKGRALFDIGELGGVLRVLFYELGLVVVEVPPSNLKQFATGKGNAGKEEVMAAAIRQLGYAGHDNNQSDALWLREMALAQYDGRALTKVQKAALAKVEWPPLAS